MKPRIGISMNYRSVEGAGERAYIDSPYFDFLTQLGAVALLIPPTENSETLGELLNCLDGVLFTGGLDLDSALWQEKPHKQSILVHPRRQRFEFMLYGAVRDRKLPVMGICLGLQMINVFHNGSLHQHLPDHPAPPDQIDHGKEFNNTRHNLNINPQSKLFDWLKADRVTVKSGHHQGINRLGDSLIPAGVADDGIVEAIESNDYPFLIATQWHPEREPSEPINQIIIEKFLDAARNSNQLSS